MKRRIVSFMLAGLLLLSGCSQSGSSGGAEDGEAGALNKNSSEEEIIAYVEERLPQVAELHELIHGGFVEVDEEDKRGLYSKFHDAEVSYNRVIDERFDSLEEIDREVSRFFRAMSIRRTIAAESTTNTAVCLWKRKERCMCRIIPTLMSL